MNNYHRMVFTVENEDEVENLCDAFDLDMAEYEEYFEAGTAFTVELTLDKSLHVVSGRIIPLSEL